jgi:hypothetical protein
MKQSANRESKRNIKTKETNFLTSLTSGNVNQQVIPKQTKTVDDEAKLSDIISTDSEIAELKWELEKHLENFRFFLDLGLKAVGLFYAILGGILSIYFAKTTDKNNEVVKVLLWVPFLISMILGVFFLIGAKLMKDAAIKLDDISKTLKMIKSPDFSILTWLLLVFGISFFVTGGTLVWLYYRLL